MTTLFSASTGTGYKVAVDRPTAAGLVPLRIERKLPTGVNESLTINLPAHTANMLSSVLETVAVRAFAAELEMAVSQ